MADGTAQLGESEPGAAGPGAQPVRLHPRRYYILALLVVVGTLNFVDRNIMSVLIEPIRKELNLNDTQMGFLSGVAFALTYVTLAIPAGWLADRWSRRKVIAAAILIWSVMTIACGLARNSFQIFMARFGVGFGEAGGSPPSQALISDLFPRHQRASAMAAFALCSSIGIALGLWFGGWALSNYGWRTTFILAGLPGLLLAPLVFFTVPEVPKGYADGLVKPPPAPPFLETVLGLWRIRTIRYLVLGSMFQTVLTNGLMHWVPAFLMRSHGMEPSRLGMLGLAVGAGLAIGTIIGGPLADWLAKRDLRYQCWMGAIGSLFSGGLSAAAFLADTDSVFLLLAAQAVFGALFAGSLFSIIMSLSPAAARTIVGACVLVVINIMTIAIAPFVVGFLSDLLRPSYGEESLRYALLAATLVALPTALFGFLASLSYRRDSAEAAERDRAAEAARG